MSEATTGQGHERCGAKTRSGGHCRLPAGHGTDHVGIGRCRRHGGNTPAHREHAQRELAERAVVAYGLPRAVSPHQALEEELHRTAGHVAWLAGVIGDLEKHQLYGPVGSADGYPRQEPHVWLRLYHEERAHLARIAKTCVDVGIEERRVRVLEQAGQQLADVVRGIVTALGHDLRDPAVERIVRGQLAAVDTTAVEVAA